MVARHNWSKHVERIVRSRHYTWIGEGLGGDQPADAIVQIIADSMHICEKEGLDFDELVEQGRRQFAEEEQHIGAMLSG